MKDLAMVIMPASGRIILKRLKNIIYEIHLYRVRFVFLTKILVYTFIDFHIYYIEIINSDITNKSRTITYNGQNVIIKLGQNINQYLFII